MLITAMQKVIQVRFVCFELFCFEFMQTSCIKIFQGAPAAGALQAQPEAEADVGNCVIPNPCAQL